MAVAVWPMSGLCFMRPSWNAFSARSRTYGTQPAPPSERMTFRPGNRSSVPLISQSTPAIIELTPFRDTITVGGASAEVVTSCEELPMCMHTGIPASSTTAHNGSQWLVCTDGSPRTVGFSENATALAPLPTTRSSSVTAASMSSSGRIAAPNRRARSTAHHSSRRKSL